jgi:hypothetical protein
MSLNAVSTVPIVYGSIERVDSPERSVDDDSGGASELQALRSVRREIRRIIFFISR